MFNQESGLEHLQVETPLGIITGANRNNWNNYYGGTYTACYKLSHTGEKVVHIRPEKNG